MKVNTQFHDLDNLLGGFQPGQLIIIAARPAMGKTSFVLNILANVAIQSKKTVSLFSLEMGSEQIVDRILSATANVPMHKIGKGLLDESVIGVVVEFLFESLFRVCLIDPGTQVDDLDGWIPVTDFGYHFETVLDGHHDV